MLELSSKYSEANSRSCEVSMMEFCDKNSLKLKALWIWDFHKIVAKIRNTINDQINLFYATYLD